MAEPTLWRPAARSRIGVSGAPRSPRRRLAVSASILGVLVLAVIIVPLVANIDQQVVDLAVANQAPSSAHPFGPTSWAGMCCCAVFMGCASR
jgi:peptide/nickel transport system permease protein